MEQLSENPRRPGENSPGYDGFVRFSIATETILKNLQRFKNEQLASFGLRSMHLMFLYSLFCAEDGLTAGELAQSCGVDKAFISRTAADLRALGYITDEDGEAARYKKRIRLTDTGRSVMHTVHEIVSDTVRKLSDGISREQFEIFYAVLARLEGNLHVLAES